MQLNTKSVQRFVGPVYTLKLNNLGIKIVGVMLRNMLGKEDRAMLDKIIVDNENKVRIIKAYTGKMGAIESHLILTRGICEYLKLSEEEIISRLNKERKMLEDTLKEGMYLISSDINDDFIKYIG